MKLVEFKTFLVHSLIKEHKDIKNKLLEFFKSNKETLLDKENGYNDNIHNLDFGKSKDPSREWVILFFPILQKKLNEMIKPSGFNECHINNLWFQQYKINGTHGWHTHGSNYTGVYYLSFDKDNPTTEILLPTDPSRKITTQVAEGDIIIFPSYFIHRAPLNKSIKIKTIISFNFDVKNPIKKYIE